VSLFGTLLLLWLWLQAGTVAAADTVQESDSIDLG
jgi:hypothetical protein